jgi:hypothetical protein
LVKGTPKIHHDAASNMRKKKGKTKSRQDIKIEQ